MSRPSPPKSRAKGPDPDPAETAGKAGAPLPARPPACEGCAFWARVAEQAGECREGPPSYPSGHFVGDGRLHVYRLTAPTLPACGRFRAK